MVAMASDSYLLKAPQPPPCQGQRCRNPARDRSTACGVVVVLLVLVAAVLMLGGMVYLLRMELCGVRAKILLLEASLSAVDDKVTRLHVLEQTKIFANQEPRRDSHPVFEEEDASTDPDYPEDEYGNLFENRAEADNYDDEASPVPLEPAGNVHWQTRPTAEGFAPSDRTAFDDVGSPTTTASPSEDGVDEVDHPQDEDDDDIDDEDDDQQPDAPVGAVAEQTPGPGLERHRRQVQSEANPIRPSPQLRLYHTLQSPNMAAVASADPWSYHGTYRDDRRPQPMYAEQAPMGFAAPPAHRDYREQRPAHSSTDPAAFSNRWPQGQTRDAELERRRKRIDSRQARRRLELEMQQRQQEEELEMQQRREMQRRLPLRKGSLRQEMEMQHELQQELQQPQQVQRLMQERRMQHVPREDAEVWRNRQRQPVQSTGVHWRGARSIDASVEVAQTWRPYAPVVEGPAIAAHFVADSSRHRNTHHYDENGRLKHPTGEYADWRASSWVRDLGLDHHFLLAEASGHVTVDTPGLYFVYAQVNYANDKDENGYWVYRNGHKELLCAITGVPSPSQVQGAQAFPRANTCFTAGVLHLAKGDRVYLRDLAGDRYRVLDHPGRSFIGLINLSSCKAKTEQPSRVTS